MSDMNPQYIQLRRFSIAVLAFATVVLLAAGAATLYLNLPKAITLLFGLTAGFGMGSLMGLWLARSALNGMLHYVRTGRLAR